MCDAVVAEDRGVAQVAYAAGVVDLLEGVLSGVGRGPPSISQLMFKRPRSD